MTGDEVEVRRVRPDEIDRVSELSVAAYTLQYAGLPADYVASIGDVAPRARDHEVWVAVDRSTREILGTVTTPRAGENLSELGRVDELDFRLLAVGPAGRGRGIGALLTTHVIELARQRGLRRVVLNSGPMMLPAHRLYERLGFERMPERQTLLDDGRPLYAYGLDVGPDVGPGASSGAS